MNWPHRVVVTGCGVVSPVGLDTATFWPNLIAGVSGIGPATAVPRENLRDEVLAEVKGFDPGRHFDARVLGTLDRVSQFAVVAAREAIAAAEIEFDDRLAERTATVIGTGIGGADTLDAAYMRLYGERQPRVATLTIPRLMPSAPASQVSMSCGLRGPAFGIVSACASATHAIGLAFQMVRAGMAEVAVAGGAESCLNLGTLKGWEAMRIMANDTCRPFSKDRRGLVIGEGAGVVVMETLAGAQARGAVIIAEIVGFGMSADARDLTNPDVGGMARALVACLDDARLGPRQVQYINAHGTGTRANDIAETAALKAAFGEHAKSIAVSSIKSMIGHALGAAGGLEFTATVLAIRDGVAPPTTNYLGADPACDLDYVPNEARTMPIDVAVSNSFAFGGLNAVLAARRFS